MVNTEYKHSELTGKIIGCAMKVQSYLGNGFQEVIYQRALAYELGIKGLVFVREIEQQIYYKDLIMPIGTRRADFVVEGKVLIELKATSTLDDVHLAQSLNYLKVFRLEIGLLINFGAKSLEYRRLIMTQKK